MEHTEPHSTSDSNVNIHDSKSNSNSAISNNLHSTFINNNNFHNKNNIKNSNKYY